ncbi:MAG: B12-binding domain-containing radical SAM protein [Candidatus Omnitrophica bacterium]|nr:B12-binding domain-containing radical SAM protein [Candidatus Omnitrophota bacterium]
MESYLYHQGIKTIYIDIENNRLTEDDFNKQLREIDATYFVINTTGKGYHFRYHFRSSFKKDEIVQKIIANIRARNPKSFIVLFGETSNVFVEKYFSFDVECILFDEPEYGMLEIVRKKIKDSRGLTNIKGLYYKHNGTFIKNHSRNTMKTLDELPPPRWENLGGHFWDSTYRERKEFIDIMGMRGCPYKCTFCKASISNKVLYHSPCYMLAQIKILNKEYGYTDFFIRDAGYFDEISRCKELCSGLKEIKGIVWKCNARIDNMNSKKLALMKEAGCSLIAYGAESGNDQTLHKVNKRITTKNIVDTVAITKQAGIQTAVYFLLGLPCESFLDQIRSMAFARKLDPDIIYISQYYFFKKSEPVKKIERTVKECIKLISVMLLFFWGRKKTAYFSKMRIDTIGANLKHYSISKHKIKW